MEGLLSDTVATTSPLKIHIEQATHAGVWLTWPSGRLAVSGLPLMLSQSLDLLALRHMCLRRKRKKARQVLDSEGGESAIVVTTGGTAQPQCLLRVVVGITLQFQMAAELRRILYSILNQRSIDGKRPIQVFSTNLHLADKGDVVIEGQHSQTAFQVSMVGTRLNIIGLGRWIPTEKEEDPNETKKMSYHDYQSTLSSLPSSSRQLLVPGQRIHCYNFAHLEQTMRAWLT
uniref:Uncharacterized protein n=1 Tax=Lotharella oceanica TaxID=641309 RepID=A0A7S2TU11_9EUKA|mmetsp:Transcript_28258/g.52788  ORF Transcript_28258/g.52788 Transcript_28258/m.52788 type:complete len:230 (+) Transcript_28258:49-738(+)|eukprot:CAMPEP_0170186502 /NCGR_PEP_ID=MMETSP0040_2-20121228/39334_1 /TAXON_ID=641309 /ORGANISM="Lotharella oceanica, Strain CCMP622" /LENGTH=229 /DNA_ID=CAMNT_0010433263 /DNA_START=45 /DNA_END=734 /DNA_ORIENTATION=+